MLCNQFFSPAITLDKHPNIRGAASRLCSFRHSEGIAIPSPDVLVAAKSVTLLATESSRQKVEDIFSSQHHKKKKPR